jgi:hypothetical protein
MSLTHKHPKQEDDSQCNRGSRLQFAGGLQTVKIGKDDQDQNRNAAEHQQRSAQQSSEQAKERSHGEGADADVFVRPFALKPDEHSQSQRNRSLEGDLHCRESLICTVKRFKPILQPVAPPGAGRNRPDPASDSSAVRFEIALIAGT